MIRKILTVLVLGPLVILIVLFALANRHSVTLSLDPFSSQQPAFALQLPLFFVILLALMFGIIVGSCVTWLKQARWRRTARRIETEAKLLHREIEELKVRVQTVETQALAPQASIQSIAYHHMPGA